MFVNDNRFRLANKILYNNSRMVMTSSLTVNGSNLFGRFICPCEYSDRQVRARRRVIRYTGSRIPVTLIPVIEYVRPKRIIVRIWTIHSGNSYAFKTNDRKKNRFLRPRFTHSVLILLSDIYFLFYLFIFYFFQKL